MFGNLMIGFAMMVMTSISDVRLYGIEDHVTLYIGAEVPVYAEADHPQGQTLIQWILNQPTYLGIKADGNEAVLMPRSVGAVDVMARLNDGSYSSRSIYVKTQYYNESTSDFKVTSGIKPIKQYGIDKKTFQIEVQSTLSVGEKVTALKNYLREIQTYGLLTLEAKTSLLDSHLIYTLGISGYPNRKIGVRLDKSDAAVNELIDVLEHLSLLNSSSSNEMPEVEKQEDNQKEESDPSLENNRTDDEFEQIKDLLLHMTGNNGSGSVESPLQLTTEQLLAQDDIVQYLTKAWQQGKLTVDEVGDKYYRLRLQSLQPGSANELYIEVIDQSLSDEGNESVGEMIEDSTDLSCDDLNSKCTTVEQMKEDTDLKNLNTKKEEKVLMEMAKSSEEKEIIYRHSMIKDESLKQSIFTFSSKNYYLVAGLILFSLLFYSGYLLGQQKRR